MRVLADPPTRLGAGPFGQHRPGPDRRRPLGPGPHPTGRLTTAPDPLAPPQHHRPATDRQVADPDQAPAVELGPHPTALTADHGGHRLDAVLPLAVGHLHGDDLEAVQTEQPGNRRTTVLTHLGPPSCRRHASASCARSQVLFWGCYIAVSNTLAHVSWRRAALGRSVLLLRPPCCWTRGAGPYLRANQPGGAISSASPASDRGRRQERPGRLPSVPPRGPA